MAKQKILIVEDERIVAEDIQRTLRNLGYTVTSIISSGREAVKDVEENKPDLVLMDIKLGGDMDGVEAAEIIRTRFNIPIIYVTALADPVTLKRAKITEPFGYIHKPIEEKELLSTIEIAIYRYEMGRKLRESEERYRTLFEQSRDAIYITSRDGSIIDVNKSFLDLFGFTGEEIIGMKAQERYIRPVDRIRFQEEIEKEGSVRDYEVKLRKKDGTEMDSLITATVRRDSEGRILGYEGVIRDITERKQAEEALLESEERLRQLIYAMPDVVYFKDTHGRNFVVNKAYEKLVGLKRENIIGRTDEELLTPDLAQQCRKSDEKAIKKRKLIQVVEQMTDNKGNKIFFDTIKSPLFDAQGNIIGLVGVSRDISEHKRAQEEIRDSEEKYRNIVELAPYGIATLNLKGVFTSCNTTFLNISGFSKNEIVNKHFTKIPTLRAKDIPNYIKIFNSIIQGKVTESVEFQWIRKEGAIRVGEGYASLMKKGNKTIGIQAIVRDITERKQMEEALKESEKRYKELWDNAPVSYHTVDTKGIITNVNQTEAKMLGYTTEEMKGKSIFEFILPEQRAEARKRFRQKISGEYIPRAKSRSYVKKDGLPIYVVIDDVLERDSKGKVIGIRTTMVDITKRRQMEQELKESEEKFRSLAEQSPNMIFINQKGRVVYVNEKCEEVTGYKRKEFYVSDFNFYSLILPEFKGLVKKCFRMHMKSEEVPPYEYAIITKEGKKIDAIITTKLITYGGDSAILGIITDISERKRAEEAMRKSEEKYRSLFEGVPVGLYRSTPEGKRIDANTTLVQMLGYPNREAFLAENVVDDYVNPEDRKRWQTQIERKGMVRGFEVQECRQDGTPIWVRENARVVRDGKGRVQYCEGAVEDITERKKTEEEKEKLRAQLIQSEKMAGLGTLASGVAHEFNNLLQIMSGHVEIAQKTKKREDIKEALDIVLDTSDRASKIIKDLLAFSRTESAEKEPYNITEPIESVLSITEEQLKKNNIRVARKYEETPVIEVNKTEIEQVFLNMVTNARDAMLSKGGKLDIGVKQVKAHIEVSFRDTGRGIKEENLGKVFEPFYTTKGSVGGRSDLYGTGLGLSVSYGIVKRHGGTIEVESQPGKGTTFIVKLPVKGA